MRHKSTTLAACLCNFFIPACSSGSSTGDRCASAGQVAYDEFTVISSRAVGASHILKFWFDERDNNGGTSVDVRLYGKLMIYESPSTSRPFGRFLLTWRQLLKTDAHDSTNIRMKGSLKTIDRTDGKVEFALHMVSGDIGDTVNVNEVHFRMRARMVTNATFTEGQAYLESKQAINEGFGKVSYGNDYYVQFNTRYLARKRVGGTTETKVYDRESLTTYGFRYGLYHEATEKRATNDSGFSIETSDGERGFVGYHGMWFPDHVTITNGPTLTRRSYDGFANTDYTAFVAPGRLTKQSRSNSTLGNMKDEEFVTWTTEARPYQCVRIPTLLRCPDHQAHSAGVP